jgi:hypothetical protein
LTIHGDLRLVAPHGGPSGANCACGKDGHEQYRDDGPWAELPGPSNDTLCVAVAGVPVEIMTVSSLGASAPGWRST